jgi:hypothetical protein
MLEVALLEKQIEEMRQLLASERSVPLLTLRNNGSHERLSGNRDHSAQESRRAVNAPSLVSISMMAAFSRANS